MNVTILTLVGTFFIALIGYIVKYLHDLTLQRRRDNLTYLEKQIGEFYGPLFILGNVGMISFNALIKRLKKEDDRHLLKDLTKEEKRIWRLWVQNVFMPNNLEMENIIKDKAYLIKEDVIPSCFIEFATHVADYKVVVAKWKEEDYSDLFAIIDFPDELLKYISIRFAELRKEQMYLIRKTQK
ncbi:MAG: hypothetical protein CFE25_00080 [Chitinophagaceae bacterium BSSC1]|nr:MAG: hypothetical protein CFE25_00080 [Chitinophagaceae bacterium BSSC1]